VADPRFLTGDLSVFRKPGKRGLTKPVKDSTYRVDVSPRTMRKPPPLPKQPPMAGARERLASIGSVVVQTPGGTVDAVRAAPGAAKAVYNYAVGHTPGEVWDDAKGAAGDWWKYAKEDPLGATADVLPVIGDAKMFYEMIDAAAQARAEGDLDTARMIEKYTGPLTLATLAPDLGGAKLLKKFVGKEGKEVAEAAVRPRYVRTEHPDGSLSVQREGLVPETVPEVLGARTLDDVRRVAATPATNPAKAMVEASRTLPEGPAPVSSLQRQSGIARAYQEAVSDNPAYKHALFERYGEVMPEVVEKSGAQNYDQLTERAYDALGDEVVQQFDRLPVSMRFHDGPLEYPTPSAMMRDALGRGNLNAFRGGDPHEFLGKIDPVTGLSLNEMFRPLHDYVGHVAPGSTFRAGGEEIAYGTHAATMSPLARMALLSETRGQNSLVNYSPLNADITRGMNETRRRMRERSIAGQLTGSRNEAEVAEGLRALRELPSADDLKAQLRELGSRTQFAEQRGVLLPPEYLDPLSEGGVPDYLRDIIQPGAPTDARAVHISNRPDLDEIDPSYYGRGHQGEEYRAVRAGGRPNRAHFYSGPEGTVVPEQSVMGYSPVQQRERYAYEAPVDRLYDIDKDPEGLVALSQAYNLPHYEPVLSQQTLQSYGAGDIAGRPASPDLERLTGEYGYRGYITDRQREGQRWGVTFDPITGLRQIERGADGYADGGRVEWA
jgi:hypothetical protein